MYIDFKYASRSLLKAPGFALTVVLTLGLGIGATTAIFSVVHATLLRPLPYPQADRIMSVRQVDADGTPMPLFSNLNFLDIKNGSSSFSYLAEYSSSKTTVLGDQGAVAASVAAVSREFVGAMGVHPVQGRWFSSDELRVNGTPAALASDAFWKSKLQGASDVVGRHIDFDGKSYSIIGVMPKGFGFPDDADLWTPIEQIEQYPERTGHTWLVVGRLKPSVSVEQARADVSRIARALKKQFGTDTLMSDAIVLPLQQDLLGHARPMLLLLFAAAGVLLLAACANAANLMLGRAAARHQELAVRAALGADRRRLMAQLFAETSLMSFAGAILGTLLAFWSVNALLGLGQDYLPGVIDIKVSFPLLAFSIGISLSISAALSVLTSAQVSRRGLFQGLKHAELRQTGDTNDARLRAMLVGTQIAIATILLGGAGLLTRSLLKVMDVKPGYRTDNILAADVVLAPTDYLEFFQNKPGARGARAERGQLYQEMERRLRALPEVTAVGLVRDRPLVGTQADGTFLVMNGPGELQGWEPYKEKSKDPERSGSAWYQSATRGFFEAMSIPLKRGRLFDERDTVNSAHVALISETLARQRWPNQDPIGRYIEFGGMDGDLRVMQIVGVVGDVRSRGLEVDPDPVIYVNALQRAPGNASLIVHTSSSPIPLIPTIGRTLKAMNGNLAPQFSTYPQIVAASFGAREFQLALVGFFACSALLLAVLGLYGVTSYTVARRTREIGVRMALGARPADVFSLVLRQGLFAVAAGIALGLCAHLALAGVLRRFVYGVTSIDPLTMVLVPFLLGGFAILACWLPARRATRVDPLIALRAE